MNINVFFISTLTILLLLTSSLFARIGIVVNKELYPSISASVQTYLNDVKRIEGKSSWLNSTTFTETNPIKQLRDSLIAHYTFDSLEGVVFIGDLPIAEYEIENDYGTAGYTDFPTDYYYMDLNGAMLDNVRSGWGKAGIFDDWSGDKKPEIWLSRITPGVLSGIGAEETVINAYFERVHKRMYGEDTMLRNYLIFGNNKEWPGLESENIGDLDYATSAITAFKRPDDTPINWACEIQHGYEYALMYEHSGPTYFQTSDSSFTTSAYLALNPKSNVRFYNLFACSNARYTENNFGGLCAFSHNGLLTIGSTKMGSMLSFQSYNQPLGDGKNFGEAFKAWVAAIGITNPYWHYGMVLQGAGTLKLQPYARPTAIRQSGKTATNSYGIHTFGSTIVYYAPNAAEMNTVTISLFNVQGKQVRTLVNGPVSSGEHSIAIHNEKAVPAGIYLCRMHANDFIQTTSVVVRR
jgi:hypothetical protein